MGWLGPKSQGRSSRLSPFFLTCQGLTSLETGEKGKANGKACREPWSWVAMEINASRMMESYEPWTQRALTNVGPSIRGGGEGCSFSRLLHRMLVFHRSKRHSGTPSYFSSCTPTLEAPVATQRREHGMNLVTHYPDRHASLDDYSFPKYMRLSLWSNIFGQKDVIAVWGLISTCLSDKAQLIIPRQTSRVNPAV